jgi:chromosomal replication initiator protein
MEMETITTEAKLVWDRCLEIIEQNVNQQAFHTWFKPLKPIALEKNTLYLESPHQFFYEWLETHYKILINRTIQTVLGPDGILSFKIRPIDPENEIVDSQDSKQDNQISQPTIKIKEPDIDSNLNQKYTFENYIMGDNNSLARSAAYRVSQQPGETSFNPLIIYGDVGLGKTHLIQAIGNEVKARFKDKRVLYVSSEKFTNDFLEAISSIKTNDFANFYRSLDVLIVDDIQFFAGKEKTQETFFHTFNTLHQQNKQIVLSSDKPPKDLKGIPERLISRFQWGLIADIQPPDLETRTAILKRKSELMGMYLDVEILEFLATNITSNIRELEGSLVALLAESSISFKPITIELAKEVIRKTSSSKVRKSISIEQIQSVVCEHFNITEEMMRSKSRKQEIAMARQVAMYLSKELTKNALKTIGLVFGGRDHSTVIHAHKTIQDMIKKDSSFKNEIDSIKRRLDINS